MSLRDFDFFSFFLEILCFFVPHYTRQILKKCDAKRNDHVFPKLNEPSWFLQIFVLENNIWRWLFHPSTPDQKKGFFDPPKLLMVLWPNQLSWEDFRWYFPNPQCQIVRGLHILTTPAGQSSGFCKKWVKKYHIAENISNSS